MIYNEIEYLGEFKKFKVIGHILNIDGKRWLYYNHNSGNGTILIETYAPMAKAQKYELPVHIAFDDKNPKETLDRFFRLMVLK